MTERQEMEAAFEAILFVAQDPIPRDKLLEVFDQRERGAAAAALEAVLDRYREDPLRGVLVDEVAGGLRLVSRPDLHSYLRRFFEITGSNRLSMPALETLAIIAYRQPVTGPEIQELRGVNSSGVMKKLLERRLIRIAGRKEVVGKPFLYATTKDFLQHFGLTSLKDLPPLEQFEELFGGDLEDGEPLAPDAEESVDREAAAVADEETEAHERAEAEAIEGERAAAEAREERADEELAETPSAAAEPERTDAPGPETDEPEAGGAKGDAANAGTAEEAGSAEAESAEAESAEAESAEVESAEAEPPGAESKTELAVAEVGA